MSFSASKLLRTDRSMSIAILLVRRLAEPAELHLHSARADLAVAEPAFLAVGRQRDALVIGADDPSFDLIGPSPTVPFPILIGGGQRGAQRDGDKPARRPPPVPWLGERPVDARRGKLEGVGRR